MKVVLNSSKRTDLIDQVWFLIDVALDKHVHRYGGEMTIRSHSYLCRRSSLYIFFVVCLDWITKHSYTQINALCKSLLIVFKVDRVWCITHLPRIFWKPIMKCKKYQSFVQIPWTLHLLWRVSIHHQGWINDPRWDLCELSHPQYCLFYVRVDLW